MKSLRIIALVLTLLLSLPLAHAQDTAYRMENFEYQIPSSWKFSEEDDKNFHYAKEIGHDEGGVVFVYESSLGSGEWKKKDIYDVYQVMAENTLPNEDSIKKGEERVLTINRAVIDNKDAAYWVVDVREGSSHFYLFYCVLINDGNLLLLVYGCPGLSTEEITKQGLQFSKSITTLYKTLNVGYKGPEVAKLKQRMFELGYYKNNTVNESYTKNTAEYVRKFEEVNGLKTDGVADSEMQELFFSDQARKENGALVVPVNETLESAEIPDIVPIMVPYETQAPAKASSEYAIVEEYKWESYGYFHNDLVIRNTSGRDCIIEVSMLFYDKSGNVIGVKNKDMRACEDGFETFWSFINEERFDSVEYEISLTEEDRFTCIQSDLDLKVTTTKNKAIVSAKNTGNTVFKYVEYNVLFMDKSGDVLGSDMGYIGDRDTEIKPGKTEMIEANSWGESFSEVKVYAHGRGD